MAPKNREFAGNPPQADPDGDDHPNLVEFAVNTSPTIVSEIPITNSRTPGGLLQLIISVRNDDPVLSSLTAAGQGGTTLTGFTGDFAPAVTDPIPGDGFGLWTFTDQPPAGSNPRRFLRAVFTVN